MRLLEGDGVEECLWCDVGAICRTQNWLNKNHIMSSVFCRRHLKRCLSLSGWKTGRIGLDVYSLIDDINISKERLTAEGGWAAWKYRKIGIGEAEFGNDFFGIVQRRWYTAQRLKCLDYPSKRLVIIWLSVYRFSIGREGADWRI